MNCFFKNRYIFGTVFLIIVLAFILNAYRGLFYNKLREAPTAENLSGNNQGEQIVSKSSETNKLKTYRNEEFGFEFQYPADWTFQINSFYSPFSKFNLEGDSSAKNYNPIIPSFMINIVTPDFAERAFASLKNMNASISTVVIAGVKGKKYEYKFENVPEINIDLPFGESHILLGATKQQEEVFNQILTTFKFLK